jgi:aminocarboxymuconate-semialdehyde decarboxylase
MTRIALDVHAHLVPARPERLAALPGVQWQPQPPRLTLDGHALGIADLYFPERLIAWMDERQVERALVSVPPPLYRQQLDTTAAHDWARYLNEGLLEIVARHADRLQALLHLPMEHPALALQLQRHYAQTGAAGVALAAGGAPHIVFSDPAFDPLWQALDEQSAFVFLHPGACGDGRLASFYLENLVGNPLETGIAAAHLVMAGVPQRYPRMRLCLAHAGGAFTGLVGRLERGFDTRRPGVDLSVERPLQAARRMYADCIAHHPSALRLAQDVFGPEHVLFGSDWPFPMGLPEGAP